MCMTCADISQSTDCMFGYHSVPLPVDCSQFSHNALDKDASLQVSNCIQPLLHNNWPSCCDQAFPKCLNSVSKMAHIND